MVNVPAILTTVGGQPNGWPQSSAVTHGTTNTRIGRAISGQAQNGARNGGNARFG